MLDNMEPKYKMLVLGGLIVGAVLAVVSLSYVLMSHPTQKTVPQIEMPDVASMTSKNVSGHATTAMVNARGYFFQYDVGFYPIVVNAIDVAGKAKSPGLLAMRSDHSILTLDFTTDDKTTSFKTLGFELPAPDQKTTRKICNIVPDMNVDFDASKRFACTHRQVFTCYDLVNKSERVGELVMESFEVELYGDPKILKEGKFSKEAIKDGCRQ